MRRNRLFWVVLAFFLLFPVMAFASSDVEERSQVFFEKKVYTDSAGGKHGLYETHVVKKGDSLWKLMGGNKKLTKKQFAEKLKDFKRTNPKVKNPSRLVPGQKIVIPVEPAGDFARADVDTGKTVYYRVKKGDNLSKIYASQGSPGGSLKEFIKTIRKNNPSIKNVNKIYAGKTLRLPAGADEPIAIATLSPSDRPVAQTDARPQAELLPKESPTPDGSFIMTGKDKPDAGQIMPPASPTYKGLLSDIFSALGEKWVEKGTMFLPLSSGEEVVLLLSDFPMVKFHGGDAALIDFQGGLPSRVREGIRLNWEYVQVVSLQDARSAADRIDRILQVSGYHSVKEGISSPLTIGEAVSVTLPARWIIQRTKENALSGDLVLLKETPEKPSAELVSILRYAQRVGVIVLPFADDPAAREGFLIGIEEERTPPQLPVALIVPSGDVLQAVDFTLSFLGINPLNAEQLNIGDKGGALQAERVFKAAGKTYVVDTGKIPEASRSVIRNAGHTIFSIKQNESGRSIFERLVNIAGGAVEDKKEHIIADGGESGYEVRIDGSLIHLPLEAPEPDRKIFLIKEKTHSATRVLLQGLGVEIVEWDS
ncbi:MAG: LysM peptidoglycan-binding domain-containing protein [Syntrophorhabdaceae bacterium]|nr:LysM peptidoglycan-binding domain-containing protein [Syntrophorhabdaceae bacterium]